MPVHIERQNGVSREVAGSGAPMSIDLFQAVQSLGLPSPKGILQVGASFGQEFKHFIDNGVTHGVFVEPLLEPFNHGADICR